MKVAESLRAIGSATTWPVETCSAATMETVPWRTYSTPAGQPAGACSSRGICGTWPGCRSSHQCRSRRCRIWPQVGVADRGGLRQNCSSSRRFSQPWTGAAPVPGWPGSACLGDGDPGARQLAGDQAVRPRGDAVGRHGRGSGHDLQPHVRAVYLGLAAARPVSQGGHAAAGEPAPPGPDRAHRAASSAAIRAFGQPRCASKAILARRTSACGEEGRTIASSLAMRRAPNITTSLLAIRAMDLPPGDRR